MSLLPATAVQVINLAHQLSFSDRTWFKGAVCVKFILLGFSKKLILLYTELVASQHCELKVKNCGKRTSLDANDNISC